MPAFRRYQALQMQEKPVGEGAEEKRTEEKVMPLAESTELTFGYEED